MKFMLLIYENPGTREAFFADDKLRAEMNAYIDGLHERAVGDRGRRPKRSACTRSSPRPGARSACSPAAC